MISAQTPSTGSMQTVRRGRSLSFVFDRDGQSISGYTCTIEVKRFNGAASEISRVIAPNGSEWPGFLTASETTALGDLGTWLLVGVITKDDTTEYQTIRFHLTEAL